ncbi:COP9 signalosome complex subunit 7-like [Bidens hawaiensis]|uniref:COP9 signalosome complex subunit 7-like n=1 Tax=Bidens hawaiensis TaxID=980011 RepID=UPI004049B1BC
MDIEEKQAEHIDHFVKQANASPPSLVNLIVEATSHPSLFAFTEILSLPNILQLQGTEDSRYLDLLQMFAHGTWSQYTSNASKLPQLTPDQVLKLKQLTMLTLAEANKVLPYEVLMRELDVVNVRELEDFLINECMYAGIVRGKLNQQRRSFEVQFAIGRDLRPGQLGNMIHTLSDWLGTSDSLLITIQEKIKWADSMNELDKKHKQENIEMLEEVKNKLSLKGDMDFRGHAEFDGIRDYGQDRRSKRRRHRMG